MRAKPMTVEALSKLLAAWGLKISVETVLSCIERYDDRIRDRWCYIRPSASLVNSHFLDSKPPWPILGAEWSTGTLALAVSIMKTALTCSNWAEYDH